ncbi:MAG: 16S rRNA (adenine(1518)-N(6)/adenine(1519)-N(6))-dimethyltransferase RsmA [Gammaproteobacteria bacterium]|nr:16S rRNA (adenine(1518)-N(6)/adenine(1519)-N(6))-dimethyltransferase RsmA [Gammaproteobacteria bacterium]MBL7000228.1 16S rRNA (adenine(1518)-N(6)/adenine(1519)-N(6))-dimethyltransferase RsmA [Gammaproteobacteria bacterium]
MSEALKHKPRKRFGQHFLHDKNIIRKLLSAMNPQPTDSIIEIGPGEGALTFPLLQRCEELTAIELDRDLIPLLQKNSKPFGTLHLINSDVLQIDMSQLSLEAPFRLAGNLPYNISTPLMFHMLKFQELIKDMHFMVQKEVAERIIAHPDQENRNSKHYGRLSVMMQYHCQCEYLFDVPPGSFSPPPKVDSAIIRLIPHAKPPVTVDDMETFAALVQAAFNQRRKTISNSLKLFIDRATMLSLDIDPGCRAENLTLQHFAQLSNHSSKPDL